MEEERPVWVIGSVAGIVGAMVVLAALVLDPDVPKPERPGLSPGLPPAGALRRHRFRLVWRGYDPAQVDARLAEVAERYGALYAAADPATIAAAETRLAAGAREPAGGSDAEAPPAPGEPGSPPGAASS
jgi:DivIVA domain-containing protein